MNNRDKTGVKAVISEERNEAGQFVKGVSGNPGGRPKKTKAELEAIDKMKNLTPAAVNVVESILMNSKASFYARLQAAEIIFNRAMGRPETYLKVDNSETSVEAAAARLQALFGPAGEESDEDPAPAVSDPNASEETEGEVPDAG